MGWEEWSQIDGTRTQVGDFIISPLKSLVNSTPAKRVTLLRPRTALDYVGETRNTGKE
jgi:hypothetical protein